MGVSLGGPAPEVGAAGGVVAELNDAGHVEHMVEAAVPRVRQAVVGVLAAGGAGRGGAGPGGEVTAVREPGDITGIRDPMDIHQV
jgi:hypothetical protein